LQLAHNSNPLASSSTRATRVTGTTSTARPTRIPPKTERTPARFSFLFHLFFFVYYPEWYSGILVSLFINSLSYWDTFRPSVECSAVVRRVNPRLYTLHPTL
jgi:hypothetical protein